MPHALDSPYVTDQLRLRTVAANAAPTRPAGEFVLYWMQATHRVDENWALRHATREADRLGLPLLIHQGLDPTYEYASDRIHRFIIAGARETSRDAERSGLTYQFVLRRRRADDRRVVDRLAARAALVVTDLFPTAGIAERTARFAERVTCHVVAVDGFTIVPSGTFTTEQYSAAVIRPKLARLRDAALEPVTDRPPARPLPVALLRSLVDELPYPPLELDTIDPGAVAADCEIDHTVGTTAVPPGRDAAHARLAHFLAGGFARYASARKEPADDDGSSRLSPYLHFGQIGPAEVARAVLEHGPSPHVDTFIDELVTWRELSFNYCLRNGQYAKLRALPDWVHVTMAAHTSDPRPALYTRQQLTEARSGDALWNAAQRELLDTGMMHNAVRMVWGKSVLLWSSSYREALATLLVLNNKYALDGRDPASFLNILWCFGKFDRPFAERPVWGKIRPMSLARARDKFNADAYIHRWTPRDAAPLFPLSGTPTP